MNLPIGVLTVYVALVIWAVLGVRGLRTGSYRAVLWFGIGLMAWLNIGYLVRGAPASIASFIGIYDVAINLGLDTSTGAAAVAACADNACTVWGDRFGLHPAWGVAFYDRFANGPQLRSTLLYGHLAFNSLAFVLLHLQLWRPGHGAARQQHRWIGRTTFLCLTIGVACAVWLASEHGPVGAYGGRLSEFGFYSMSAFVYGCAVMGIAAARSGKLAQHRVWMFRLAGAMWGSFWLFRVMLFVLDPLLRNVESAAILICIWFSAPLGILCAELIRRRLDRKPPAAAGRVAFAR